MSTLVHVYIHGEATNVALRELAEKAVAQDEKRISLASELADLSHQLDQIEERQVSAANYASIRFGAWAVDIQDLVERLAALEKRFTGGAAPPATP